MPFEFEAMLYKDGSDVAILHVLLKDLTKEEIDIVVKPTIDSLLLVLTFQFIFQITLLKKLLIRKKLLMMLILEKAEFLN